LKSDEIYLRGMGFIESLAIFGIASVILIIETQFLIPYLNKISGWETIVCWFIVAGLGFFLPMLITAILILRKEGFRLNKKVWIERLRFRKMTKSDWLWSIGAIFVIMLLSTFIVEILKSIISDVNYRPTFMSFEPLSAGRYWILLLWFPYWILNIMGEEILWRGTLLPHNCMNVTENTITFLAGY